MVGSIAKEEEWNSTIDAFSIGIILARACLPAAVINDVILPRWVFVEGPGRHGRNWVFAVGDAGKDVQIAINEIGELLVPDLKEFIIILEPGERDRAKMRLTRGDPYP